MKYYPLVSIIVCAYNVEKYIDESITSIINQTYKNLEIIIINDGSTDLTLSHLERLNKLDERIKIINNKHNLGFINSLNKNESRKQMIKVHLKAVFDLDSNFDFFGPTQKYFIVVTIL